MKILHLSGARSWGGNEQQLSDIIPELEKLGIENFVFGVENSPLHNYYKNTSTIFICCKEKKLNKFKNYKYLKSIVKEIKPDIIHMHTSDSVTVFTISDLLFQLKTPGVFSKKGMGNSMSVLSKFKYNYKNIKKIICVSKAVEKGMKEFVMKPKNFNKLEVVYDGININRIGANHKEKLTQHYSIADGNYIIGNIANHGRAKDLMTLIRAIHHLVYTLDFTNFHVFQIGKYSVLTEELKIEIKNLKIEKYITLTDFKNQATGYLSQFDLYVMSSEREGLPLTIYEAFYKKIPVVSTMAGGIPEVINDNSNGFLVAIHDYKNLAIKMKELLLDTNIQKQFSEKSYTLFKEKFEASKTAKNTKIVYKSIM